jgi:NADPH-dependent 2,4-dienoyl-CoA reductase/sulfur reductase-like enzyme/nitrite reductase/ring-hydroxylating ferredoxin subunit
MAGTEWTKVAQASDLKEGVPLGVKAGEEDVLLVRRGRTIYACGAKCSHYGGPLAKGVLRGDAVTCPWHNARFDVRSGDMLAPPALDGVGCCPVKEEGGAVYVGPRKKPAIAMPAGKDPRTVAIVGAGAAGNAAAQTLRREGFAGRILLITGEPHGPYDRPNLSKDYLAGTADPSWIPLRGPKFYERLRIELLTGRAVRALNPHDRTIAFADGSAVRFDLALVATGGVPRRLNVSGDGLEGVFCLRSLADAEAIIASAEKAESAVIVGAGFIGMEAASSLRHRGLEVHVVAPEKVPMERVFGDRIGTWLRGVHEAAGVRFHLARTVKGFKGDGRVREAVLEDGGRIKADLAIIGLGVAPAVDCLQGTGLVKDGAVPVNGRLETAAAGVFAAGDIALVPAPRTGQAERIEHWVVAERQGCHAARAMLGSPAPYDEVPFFWTMQFEKPLQYVGLARRADRIVYRGPVGDDGFLAGYYEGGVLRAAAGFWRDREIIALAEALKARRAVTPEAFQDQGVDLMGLSQ